MAIGDKARWLGRTFLLSFSIKTLSFSKKTSDLLLDHRSDSFKRIKKIMSQAVAVRPGIQGIHRIPWRSLNNIFSVVFDMSFSIPSFKIHCQLLLFYIKIFLSDFVYEYEASIEQWP